MKLFHRGWDNSFGGKNYYIKPESYFHFAKKQSFHSASNQAVQSLRKV